MKIKNFIGALLGVGLVALGFTGAASGQTVITSGAAGVVGAAPACEITIYVAGFNCRACEIWKRQYPETGPGACPSIKHVQSPQGPWPQVSWPGGAGTYPNGIGQAYSYCNEKCREGQPPSTNPGVGNGGGGNASGGGGNPASPNSFQCTGEAKIKCGSSCCLFACNQQGNGCLNCAGFRPCAPNSCSNGQICENPRDEKGCPQNFICKDKPSVKPPAEPEPPVGPCTGESCNQPPVDDGQHPSPVVPEVEDPKKQPEPPACTGDSCSSSPSDTDPSPKTEEPKCYEGRCDDPTPPPQPPAGRCSTPPLTQECSTSDSWTCCRPEELCGRDSQGFATCLPGGLIPRESLGN